MSAANSLAYPVLYARLPGLLVQAGKQIKGFARYGFCEGHAVAFASHAQGTAYLLNHYPAEFLAATLSVEPCGFWSVATVTSEAVRRGVQVLAPCLNRSRARYWGVEEGASSETGKAIRCALSFVQGVGEDMATAIALERDKKGVFKSLADVGRRLWFVPRDALEWLALAGALDTFEPSRRQVLWSLPAVHQPPSKRTKPTPGQDVLALLVMPSVPVDVPDFNPSERFAREWAALGFSMSGHPMTFYRKRLKRAGAVPCAELQGRTAGETVTLGGLCLRPHHPPTPSGETWVFFTLEDETSLAQVTLSPDAYKTSGGTVFGEAFVLVTGTVEARGVGKIVCGERVTWLR